MGIYEEEVPKLLYTLFRLGLGPGGFKVSTSAQLLGIREWTKITENGAGGIGEN